MLYAPSRVGTGALSGRHHPREPVPPRRGVNSALGLRASGPRTDSITLLHLSFPLMRPYGSPLPPCIRLGCRIVEIAIVTDNDRPKLYRCFNYSHVCDYVSKIKYELTSKPDTCAPLSEKHVS
ncbi:hypothetical protein NDU88_004863 [Pleurodeles waltl]|uniref:Uncharacterized protein n=1 Tax=Pleurodeles waltl TaxID=8319 RepID=A0AAV7QE76_PLEWA|nr:hypothetical protein NDU88_004863 [Pleurodeles waltl]